MKTKTLGLFAIPIFAAIMFSGSIAPVANADHTNNAECERLLTQLDNALESGNAKRLAAAFNAFDKTCTGVGGQECNAISENLQRAVERGDIEQSARHFDQLKALGCFG